MDAKTIRESLSENDILSLLEDLGAEPYFQNSNLISRTVCHNQKGEGSHKLYYYDSSKSFYCYSSCGSMSIFDLISSIKKCDFIDSLRFVKDYFGIRTAHIDFEEKIDMSFFNKFNKTIDFPELPCYDDSILKLFSKKYYYGWVKDYISPNIMRRYNIKMDIFKKQIIIPHYDIEDNLVGVRVRNLDESVVQEGKKYMPLYYNNKSYRHMTGSNLYGINISKDTINKVKKVVLFEGEKSVLALDTFYGGEGIGVGTSGASLSDHQIHLIDQLDVEEIVIAYDKEFHKIGDKYEKFYADKISNTIINKLKAKYKVSIIWDTKELLDYKDSPTDKGFDIWNDLWYSRIRLN